MPLKSYIMLFKYIGTMRKKDLLIIFSSYFIYDNEPYTNMSCVYVTNLEEAVNILIDFFYYLVTLEVRTPNGDLWSIDDYCGTYS
jgi:hypothetical protein